MSPRTGRPIVDGGRKDVQVKVRFDAESHNKLMEYCNVENITRTEAIRRAVKLLVNDKK